MPVFSNVSAFFAKFGHLRRVVAVLEEGEERGIAASSCGGLGMPGKLAQNQQAATENNPGPHTSFSNSMIFGMRK
jgi:hypothetical protein